MYLLIIFCLSWIISQSAKFLVSAFKYKPDLRLFFHSGGMPSAHSATVVSFATAAGVLYGFNGPIFGIASALAIIVMYDSLGVRRASGEQSVALNVLIKSIGSTQPVREILGHTPSEVFVGAVLGVITGLTLTFSQWSHLLSQLSNTPPRIESWLYLGIFSLILLVGTGVRLWLNKLRKVAIIAQLKVSYWFGVILPVFLGLFSVLLQFQTVNSGSWRVWALLSLGLVVLIQLLAFFWLYHFATEKYNLQIQELKAKRKIIRGNTHKNRKKSKNK